jgi:capsule biosynthesis phosphatase
MTYMMRIIIDLDGTICPIKGKEESYADLKPFAGAVERLNDFKNAGHYIIIQTARNMGTQESNLGKVMKNIGKVTLDWLDCYQVPYDEIYFGKPNGHIYIDDRAFRFNEWDTLTAETLKELGREK